MQSQQSPKPLSLNTNAPCSCIAARAGIIHDLDRISSSPTDDLLILVGFLLVETSLIPIKLQWTGWPQNDGLHLDMQFVRVGIIGSALLWNLSITYDIDPFANTCFARFQSVDQERYVHQCLKFVSGWMIMLQS